MRFKKTRLIEPITALKAKMTANCHGCGAGPSPNAASTLLAKQETFTNAASRDRYRPRMVGGTSEEIHGSQPALEMPRDRLNPNNSARINARRVGAVKN